MRMVLNPRAARLLQRAARANRWTLLELALLSLLALQCARLLWTVATPVGPLGDWKPAEEASAAPTTALAASFDPFFRLTRETGPAVVTALNLKLHGIRQDQASGRGSAIIATPDGRQRSFVVGEEIMPGVTLAAVAFDGVTISRGGATEQLFMDQSPIADAPAAADASPAPPAPSPAQISAPPAPPPAAR